MKLKIIRTDSISVLYARNGFISVSTGNQVIDPITERDQTTKRDRPYDGQAHTDHGERGKMKVYGLTMRDISDCILKGMVFAMPNLTDYDRDLAERDEFDYNYIFDFDFSKVDPIAIIQNAMCEVEKRMGIFPNIEPTERSQE